MEVGTLRSKRANKVASREGARSHHGLATASNSCPLARPLARAASGCFARGTLCRVLSCSRCGAMPMCKALDPWGSSKGCSEPREIATCEVRKWRATCSPLVKHANSGSLSLAGTAWRQGPPLAKQLRFGGKGCAC